MKNKKAIALFLIGIGILIGRSRSPDESVVTPLKRRITSNFLEALLAPVWEVKKTKSGGSSPPDSSS